MRDLCLAVCLACFPFVACVSASSLRNTAEVSLQAEEEVLRGLDGLDALCQSHAHTADDLNACRAKRDYIRAALSRQHAAWTATINK